MSIISSLPVTLANGTTGDATQVMQDFNSIVSQVNANAMAADGSVTATANLNIGSHKLTNVATGTASTDGINLAQLTTATPWTSCMVIAYMTNALFTIVDEFTTEVGSGVSAFTVVKDAGGNFDSVTGRFTAPATGIYLVSICGTLAASTATDMFQTYFASSTFGAGTYGVYGSTSKTTGPTAGITAIRSAGSSLVSLTAGDIRSMWAFHSSGGINRNMVGAELGATEITIMRIT